MDWFLDFRTRLFHLWFRLARPMTLGVRGLVFDEDNRLLLVRHTYVTGWHLCGGGVEAGETLVDALAKELDEEAHVVLTAPPELISVHFNNLVSKRDHVAVFLCRNARQTKSRAPDREILEARFFPLDGLPEGVAAGSQRRIDEYINQTPPDAFW